jgi:hypothetical protein
MKVLWPWNRKRGGNGRLICHCDAPFWVPRYSFLSEFGERTLTREEGVIPLPHFLEWIPQEENGKAHRGACKRTADIWTPGPSE